MASLLLVDDDPKLILNQVSHVFAPDGVQIDVARPGPTPSAVRPRTPVVVAGRAPAGHGRLEVYQRLRQIDARVPSSS